MKFDFMNVLDSVLPCQLVEMLLLAIEAILDGLHLKLRDSVISLKCEKFPVKNGKQLNFIHGRASKLTNIPKNALTSFDNLTVPSHWRSSCT